MKLSDLIFEAQILLEEKFEVRRKGKTFGVYNTTVTPNVLISSHKTKGQAEKKVDQLRNPKPPSANKTVKQTKGARTPASKVVQKMPTGGGLMKGMFARGPNAFTIIFPDGKGYVNIEGSERDANRLQKYIEKLESQGKTPKQITDEFTKNRGGFLAEADVDAKNVKNYKTNPIKRQIRKMQIADFAKEMEARSKINKFANTKIMKWTLTPAFNSFKTLASYKLGTIAMGYLAIFLGTTFAIAEVEAEMIEKPGDESLKEEYQILLGSATIQMGLFIFALLKDLKSVRGLVKALMKPIRLALTAAGMVVGGVAGAVGGAAVGGAGAVPGAAIGAVAGNRGGRIVSILMREGLSLALFFALSLPAVQRFIAELLQGWWLGDAFAFVGKGVESLLQYADEALEGAYGTGFLADKLTIEQTTKEGPDGEYFSDSEWAKLVFGALLFPEGETTKFVPYMPEAKREDMMTNLLSPENSQPKADPDANDPRGKDQIPPASSPEAETTTTAS